MLITHRCTKCKHPDYWRRRDAAGPGPCECGCKCAPEAPKLAPTFNMAGRQVERIAEPGTRLVGDGTDPIAEGASVTACGCSDCKALYAELTGSTPAPTPAELTPTEYRAWAAANNVPCPASGRIPAAVREAYTAAHS